MTDSRRENIKIGISAGILVTMLVASVGFAFHAGRVRQMVDNNTAAIIAVSDILETHIGTEGHAVMVERVGALSDDVAEVKKGVDKNADSLDRIEAKLEEG